jgi:hypothetical protein
MVEDIEDLKLKINNLLWMYSDDKLTFGEAEERAIDIMAIIRQKPKEDI